LRPTREVKAAAQDAMNDWLTWDTFDHEKPYGGGTENQEVEWLDAIRAIESARKAAEADSQAEEEARQAAEAKKKK
jgi:hypothetical protein